VKRAIKKILGESRVKSASLNIQEVKQRISLKLSGERLDSMSGIVLSLPKHDVYFGYYDKSPFNADDSLILSLAKPAGQSKSLYGVWIKESGLWSFNSLGSTEAWNYQMGSRLQWSNSTQSCFIVNVLSQGTLCSLLIDAKSGQQIEKMKYPVFEQSKCGNFFVTLDFLALEGRRAGYGYNLGSRDDRYGNSGALYKFSRLEQGLDLLVSPKDCSDVLNTKEPGYLNHPLISPDGDFMIFLYVVEGEPRRTYLFGYVFSAQKLVLINSEGWVSHFNWIRPNEIVAYCLHGGIKSLYRIRINDKYKAHYCRIRPDEVKRDCHPTYINTHASVLVDSYPDKMGLQTLKVVPLDKNKPIKQLSNEYLKARFNGPLRCDLHPRLSRDESVAIIDSVANNFRVIKLFDI